MRVALAELHETVLEATAEAFGMALPVMQPLERGLAPVVPYTNEKRVEREMWGRPP